MRIVILFLLFLGVAQAQEMRVSSRMTEDTTALVQLYPAPPWIVQTVVVAGDSSCYISRFAFRDSTWVSIQREEDHFWKYGQESSPGEVFEYSSYKFGKIKLIKPYRTWFTYRFCTKCGREEVVMRKQ